MQLFVFSLFFQKMKMSHVFFGKFQTRPNIPTLPLYLTSMSINIVTSCNTLKDHERMGGSGANRGQAQPGTHCVMSLVPVPGMVVHVSQPPILIWSPITGFTQSLSH